MASGGTVVSSRPTVRDHRTAAKKGNAIVRDHRSE
jgi:hypothetical protein